MKKLLLAACMTVLLILGITVGAVSAKADDLVPVDASAGLNLYTLAEGGYLKLTGRAIANSEGYIETDFSSCGFEVIINAPAATDLTLTYSSYSGAATPDQEYVDPDANEYTAQGD